MPPPSARVFLAPLPRGYGGCHQRRRHRRGRHRGHRRQRRHRHGRRWRWRLRGAGRGALGFWPQLPWPGAPRPGREHVFPVVREVQVAPAPSLAASEGRGPSHQVLRSSFNGRSENGCLLQGSSTPASPTGLAAGCPLLATSLGLNSKGSSQRAQVQYRLPQRSIFSILGMLDKRLSQCLSHLSTYARPNTNR